MENLSVKKVIIAKQEKETENYRQFIKIAKQRKIEIITIQKGNEINIDKELKLKILWPQSQQIQENILNNNSIVAKLCYRKFSILFTGDIEEKAEKQMLSEYKEKDILNSTVLKVAHHGSKTSSTTGFLEKVRAKIAFIGVGKKNLFNHPNEEVIEILKKCRIKIYRTDKNGEIFLKINKDGKIKTSTQILETNV